MCTEFLLPLTNEHIISGRSMDFKTQYNWGVLGVPAGSALHAFAHLHLTGPGAFKWNAKYDSIGLAIQLPLSETLDILPGYGDAMNSQGLSAAALWMPHSIYPKVESAPSGAKLVSCMDIVAWAVSNYATVDELKADLQAIADKRPTQAGDLLSFWDPLQLPKWLSEEQKNYQPLHFQFHDKSGKSLVLEFAQGELVLTDNSDLGVMTNYPSIAWHRTNLGNYLPVSNLDIAKGQVNGLALEANGHGNGTLAIPGSASPPARFVRTAMLISFAQPWLQQASTDQAQAFALNVISNAAVPRMMSIDEAGKMEGDYTQWTAVRNHNTLDYYIRTADGVGTWHIRFRDFMKDKPCFVPLPNENKGVWLAPPFDPIPRPSNI